MARKWTIRDIPSQKGRLAVVTGGNRGLGLEIVLALARARLGGYTGDVLGAAAVIGETAGLLAAAGRW